MSLPGAEPSPPRRVRVTSPRRAAGRPRARPRAHDIDEQTALGEVYLDALLRTQARQSLVALVPTALAVLLLMGLAIVSSARSSGSPVPLDWIIAGVAAYPVICAAAWFYARGADRVEDEFVDLLRRR